MGLVIVGRAGVKPPASRSSSLPRAGRPSTGPPPRRSPPPRHRVGHEIPPPLLSRADQIEWAAYTTPALPPSPSSGCRPRSPSWWPDGGRLHAARVFGQAAFGPRMVLTGVDLLTVQRLGGRRTFSMVPCSATDSSLPGTFGQQSSVGCRREASQK